MTKGILRRAADRNPEGVRRLARYLGICDTGPVWQVALAVARTLIL